MISVHLNQLQFTAYHGIEELEKVLGNTFLVDCTVSFFENETVIHHIEETVNYVRVYEIITERMKIATPLLETVVMEMGNEIAASFPGVKSVQINLKKLEPPIPGIKGSVGVSWHKEF